MPNARYGYVLATDEDGRVVWSSINDNNILPSQSGNADLFLSTTGSGLYWAAGGASINVSPVSNDQAYYPVFASGSGVLTQAHIKSSFYPLSFNPSQNRLSVENSTINTLTIGSGNSGGIGQLSWNPDDGTLDLGLLGGNATLQVGQELMARVFNDNGVQINDGEVVAINGAQGQRVSVIKAVASGAYLASHAFGVATENIPVGEEGFVTVFGTVRNLNTYINGSSEGAEIFLSPTTPGAWTTTRPSAPNHAISLGFIQREHHSAGSIFVRVSTGEHLEYLHDVLITTPSSGQALIYDSSNSTWKNRTLSETIYTAGSGLTLVDSQFHLAGTGVLNKLTINNQQSSNVPLISKGAAAQSANLFEAQNVSGTNLVYIDKDGDIFSAGSGTFEFVQLNSSLTSPSGLLFLNPNKVVSHSPNVLFSNTNLSSPKLIFKASGSATPDISLNILTTASGSVSGVQTLSFEGSAGQLFSISDVLGSGTIFSVNDISGLPLIEADASGFVRLARFGADVEVYKQLELMPTGTTAGQTNELRFFELAASGQNYVGFKAPDSLVANRVWTLPTGDGASNQLLTTNGAGVLSWSTPIPTSGTATALNTTAVSTNATFYPVLSSGAGGGFAASIDTGLTYNPSTDMLTASGITANRIVGSANIIITESTTSRTLQAGDNGGVIMCTNNSGATLTLPTGLAVGFSVGVLAAATGVVSFTASGTTLNNRQSHTKLAGQWAMGTIIQRTTNNFVLAGDTV